MDPEKRREISRRAANGAAAVRAGTPDFRLNDDAETDVCDALTNIMHYCAQQGVDFSKAEAAATGHFHAERRGELL